MSKFINIDERIHQLAIKLNAKLSKDRPNYPEPLRNFEERRIDWIEDSVNKAIIIQPNFTSTGVDSSKWSFINLAWIKKKGIAQKPGWRKILIDKEDFSEIETRIDELLSISVTNLKTITIIDVKEVLK